MTGAGAKAASVQLLSLTPQDLEPQSDLPLPHLGVNPKVSSEARGVQRVHHGRGRIPVTQKNLDLAVVQDVSPVAAILAGGDQELFHEHGSEERPRALGDDAGDFHSPLQVHLQPLCGIIHLGSPGVGPTPEVKPSERRRPSRERGAEVGRGSDLRVRDPSTLHA